MGVKQMITTQNKQDIVKNSNHACSTVGVVSSINANTNVEGTIVIKNVPLEFIQQLNVGCHIEVRYDKN